MAVRPLRSTVTIDGMKFDAMSASIGFTTDSDHAGLPVMGSLRTSIEVIVDIHDDVNIPFSTLKKLFELAYVVTRDKIKDIKIEFWKDESHQDVICSYTLKGWIGHWQTHSASDSGNNILVMIINPAMNQENFQEIALSN